MAGSLKVALWAVCALLVASVAHAQMPWPVVGQGEPPPGITFVTVDILIDSVESINSNQNSFGAVFWLHMVWPDARALPAMLNSTARWAQGGSCTRMCEDGNNPSGGCCDGVWLPHIDLPNLKYIPQEFVLKQRIWLEPAADGSAGTSGSVHWSVRITADFHSPYDFRAWPFEHQHLIMEMQVPPSLATRVGIILDEVNVLSDTAHTKGEVVPGWWIAKVTKRAFDISACYNTTRVTTTLFAIDPAGGINGTMVALQPLRPDMWAQLSTPNNVEVTSLTADKCSYVKLGTKGYHEAQSQYNPRVMVADIMVKRAKSYYTLANIVPMLILAYMSFLIYSMERNDIESRLMVIVTLVLATSALQFTWSFPPANYLNAVQQVTLTSYVLYFMVAIESMITSYICRVHEHRRQKQAIQTALYGPGPLMAVKPAVGRHYAGTIPPTPPGTHDVGGSGGDSRGMALQPMESLPEEYEEPEDTPGLPQSSRNYRGAFATSGSGLPGRSSRIARLPSDAPPGPVGEGAEGSESSGSAILRTVPQKSDDGLAYVTTGAMAAGANSGNAMMGASKNGALSVDLSWGMGMGMPSNNKTPNKPGAKPSFARMVSTRISNAAKSTRVFSQRLSKDEAYALRFARRLDLIFCWSLLFCYTVVIIVLLYINSAVGDHKLMLVGSRPANM